MSDTLRKSRAVDRAMYAYEASKHAHTFTAKREYDAEGRRELQASVATRNLYEQISEAGVNPLRVRR